MAGPFRIREIPENSTFYRLEELNGTPLAATFAGNHLKRFFTRRELDSQRAEIHDTIRVTDQLGLDHDDDEQELEDGVARENMDVAAVVGDD